MCIVDMKTYGIFEPCLDVLNKRKFNIKTKFERYKNWKNQAQTLA
jgi:hypothetical protein